MNSVPAEPDMSGPTDPGLSTPDCGPNDTGAWANSLWEVRDNRGLSAYAKLAYVMLAARLPNVHPSLALLAEDMGVSRATAKRAVRELEAAGLVRSVARTTAAGDADSNSYELNPAAFRAGGGVTQTPPRVTQTRGSGPTDPRVGSERPPKITREDLKVSRQPSGPSDMASRRARPAVGRALEMTNDDMVYIVRVAVEQRGWQDQPLTDEDAVTIYHGFAGTGHVVYPRYFYSRRTRAGVFKDFACLADALAAAASKLNDKYAILRIAATERGWNEELTEWDAEDIWLAFGPSDPDKVGDLVAWFYSRRTGGGVFGRKPGEPASFDSLEQAAAAARKRNRRNTAREQSSVDEGRTLAAADPWQPAPVAASAVAVTSGDVPWYAT